MGILIKMIHHFSCSLWAYYNLQYPQTGIVELYILVQVRSAKAEYSSAILSFDLFLQPRITLRGKSQEGEDKKDVRNQYTTTGQLSPP